MDVAIIGAGPAGLFLSYLLQGNIPVYDRQTFGPHPDSQLDQMLSRHANLLEAVQDETLLRYVGLNYESFFTAKVWPVNLLYDALVVPCEWNLQSSQAMESRVKWVFDPKKALEHEIISSGPPGGQWSQTLWDDRSGLALSYSEMLAMPNFPVDEFLEKATKEPAKPYFRPKREDVAEYYDAFCKKERLPLVRGTVASVQRDSGMFEVATATHQRLYTQTVVLASGSNSEGYECDNQDCGGKSTIIVVGTGVSAADAVIAGLHHNYNVVHLYWWNADGGPSQIKKYPRKLYPEYAEVYQYMRERTGPGYTGVPNGRIVKVDGSNVELDNGEVIPQVYRIVTRAGRCGNLDYCSSLGLPSRVFRGGIHKELPDIQVPHIADGVWAVGSLTGDSLVRFTGGMCILAAAQIFEYFK